jgi:hypothetical protein
MEIGYWTKNIVLFALHVGIWTLWTLLIRASQPYAYENVTVVFLTELAKFVLSAAFHFHEYVSYRLTDTLLQANHYCRHHHHYLIIILHIRV